MNAPGLNNCGACGRSDLHLHEGDFVYEIEEVEETASMLRHPAQGWRKLPSRRLFALLDTLDMDEDEETADMVWDELDKRRSEGELIHDE